MDSVREVDEEIGVRFTLAVVVKLEDPQPERQGILDAFKAFEGVMTRVGG